MTLSLTMTVIDDISVVLGSSQFITVPVRPLLTGLISNLDITGKAPSADVFVKLNTVEVINRTGKAWSGGVAVGMTRSILVAVVILSLNTSNLHSWSPVVVLHVNSNCPPLHTGAFSVGDIIAVPEMCNTYYTVA